PPATLEAYQDHGNPAARLEEGAGEAARIVGLLPRAGIDLDAVAAQLQEDGVRQFQEAFNRLLERLGQPSGLPAATASR
ncbi:MAG TPA: transaldolase family protein, partial [Bryobacteraceae bacterium]|nr:transaldolase family protein [Bryobacteraceae bacterium]